MNTSKDPRVKLFEVNQDSELIMHLGLGLTLFFPRPFSDVRAAIWDLWQKYLLLVGKENFTWARLGGGNRSRAVNASTFRTIEAWLTGTKDYGKNCWISIHDGPMDGLGQYGFKLEGLGCPGEDEVDVNCLDMRFPINWLDSVPGPALAEQLVSLVEKVPFYSGVAGFVFHHSPHMYSDTIGKMAALSKRFEGVEVSATNREKYWASKGLVSVNWITLLGDGLVAKLGGHNALPKKLPIDCKVVNLEHGVAVRSGDAPLLGDKNAGKDELKLWRNVYHVLKPLQFVEIIRGFDPFKFNGERTKEWLQRLEL